MFSGVFLGGDRKGKNDNFTTYGELMYTLFMSYMARDNILMNIHQLKVSPFNPPPTPVVIFLIKYSLTYQIILKIKSS